MNINNEINQLLIDEGLSQGDLADALGLSRVHVCKVINGQSQGRPTRYKIAKFFKREVGELWPVNGHAKQARRKFR